MQISFEHPLARLPAVRFQRDLSHHVLVDTCSPGKQTETILTENLWKVLGHLSLYMNEQISGNRMGTELMLFGLLESSVSSSLRNGKLCHFLTPVPLQTCMTELLWNTKGDVLKTMSMCCQTMKEGKKKPNEGKIKVVRMTHAFVGNRLNLGHYFLIIFPFSIFLRYVYVCVLKIIKYSSGFGKKKIRFL